MLTITKIKNLPRPQKHPSLHADRDGLYLKHAPSGRKTWVYRSRKGGKWTVQKIGDFPAIKIDVARARVAALVNREFTAPPTRDLVDEFWSRRIEKRYKQTKNVKVYAERMKNEFGQKPVDELTTRSLVDNLKVYAKDAPVAANRCLAFWKLIMKFAVESGYIRTSPLNETTAKVIGGEETEREVTLTDEEIVSLWQSTHEHSALLRGLLLTGCRISELQSAHAEQIEGDVLNIPETKSKRPHWVYITPALREQFGDFNGRLFKPVSPTAVQARLRRINSRWRPHDLRRTFATLSARTQPLHVVSKCLNHVLPGMLSIYNQHEYPEERKQTAIDVAAYIEEITSAKN